MTQLPLMNTEGLLIPRGTIDCGMRKAPVQGPFMPVAGRTMQPLWPALPAPPSKAGCSGSKLCKDDCGMAALKMGPAPTALGPKAPVGHTAACPPIQADPKAKTGSALGIKSLQHLAVLSLGLQSLLKFSHTEETQSKRPCEHKVGPNAHERLSQAPIEPAPYVKHFLLILLCDNSYMTSEIRITYYVNTDKSNVKFDCILSNLQFQRTIL